MFNEGRHLVTVFKDYLILDDQSEYLKRWYHKHESTDRVVRAAEYYQQFQITPLFCDRVVTKVLQKNRHKKAKQPKPLFQGFKGEKMFGASFFKVLNQTPRNIESLLEMVSNITETSAMKLSMIEFTTEP